MELVIILVSLVASGIGAYVGSFIKQTAKVNADNANSDKIVRLTEVVEKVKSEFEKNNEILRNTLDLQKQHKIGLKKLEVDAYLDYNKVVTSWLSGILSFPITNYSLDNFEKLRPDYELQFSKTSYNEALAYGPLLFFDHDEHFHTTLHRDLTIELTLFSSILSKYIFKVEDVFSRTRFDLAKIDLEQIERSENTIRKNDRRKVLNDELKSIYEKYSLELLTQYTQVYKLYREFTQYAKGKINKIGTS